VHIIFDYQYNNVGSWSIVFGKYFQNVK